MHFRKNLKKLIFGLAGIFIIAQFVFFGIGAKQAQALTSPLPDFIITGIRFDPPSPSAGQTFTPYVTFKNIGSTKAGGYWGVDILGQFSGSNQNDFGGSLWPISSSFLNNQTYELGLGDSKINQAGTYAINFKVDSLNQVVESNENNNNYAASIVVKSKLPDPQSVIVEEETGVTANTLRIDSLAIHWTNPSDIDTNKTKISIYRSNKSGELGSLKIGPAYVNSIQGYYDKYVEPYVPYYYTLIYTADDGRVSTGNVQYTGILKKPDVVVKSVSFPSQVTLGSPTNLDITLTNNGESKMRLDWLELKIDITGPKNTTVTSTISTGRLLVPANYNENSAIAPVNFVKEYTHSIPLNFTELGNYTINATVDPNNKLLELYKTNNSGQATTQAVTSGNIPKVVKVISPNGYEQWEKGKTYNILWEGPTDVAWSGNSVTINLYKIVNDNLLFVKEIAERLPLQINGSYSWAVPTSLDLGANYRIRINYGNSNSDNSYDLSDYPFIIKDAEVGQSIQLTYPNGGETFTQGASNIIKWKGGKTKVQVGLVKPEYALKDGAVEGWIFLNGTPDSQGTWDGKYMSYLTGTTQISVVPGSYKIITVSEGSPGYCTWNLTGGL